MSRVAALSMAALALFAPAGVNAEAENVDCPEIPASGGFPDGTLCKSLPGVLDDAGWPRTAVEISSNELTIGTVGADSADLTFNLLHDDGAFQFCFGFCLAGDLDAATLDAVRAGTATDEEQLAFAKNCVVDNGKMVFDDRDHDDGAIVTVPGVPVPADVIFYLIPDEEKESFAANPETFWATERHPLFSLSGANPEYLDQLVLFQNEGNTLFAWEDKTRVRGSGTTPIDSDEDFGDLVFKLDALVNEKIPTDDSCPDDCTGTVATYRPAENQEEIATADGNCACLTFEC